MPPRQFDRAHVREVRRRLELDYKDVGARLGVTGTTVRRWELGEEMPKQERLPALAAALGQPLDALFPCEGPADLERLRCDAGLSMEQARGIIGTTRVPLRNAERGKRRLQEAFVQPLAAAYKVTVEQLLAAQKVSFGTDTATVPAPRLVGEKINYLLKRRSPSQASPSDEDIARAVSAHVGSAVTTADITAFRSGEATEASLEVRAGLARALEVPDAIFADDTELSREKEELIESLAFLGSIEAGQILGLAARGNESGLPLEVIRRINGLVGELKGHLPVGTDTDSPRSP
ncbi:helix-turn-helix domain-containing protein [Streptomyces goshikiensis]|uniref:helix-turn-helix domain-containing protein n=1 Tax=Streptomyces goshikiensis TaxID=1942 RepID=UPI00367FDABF